MSEIVVWHEIVCPECQTRNMLYYGDPNDVTAYEPDVLECYKCGVCSEIFEGLVDDEGKFNELCDGAEIGLTSPRKHQNFEDLPILLNEVEYGGEWRRNVKRKGTVKDLLKIWNIDDPSEDSEIIQVLRHLRRTINNE